MTPCMLTEEIVGESGAFFVSQNGRAEEARAVAEPNTVDGEPASVDVDAYLASSVHDDLVVDRSPLVQLDGPGVHLTRGHAVKHHIIPLVAHYVHCTSPDRTADSLQRGVRIRYDGLYIG